jgi:LysM repeat protein
MENHSELNSNRPQEPVVPKPSKQRFTLSSLEILFGTIVLLGLLYMGYFILFQDTTGSNTQIEKKLKTLESAVKEQDEKLDKKLKTIQENLSQMETRIKNMEAHQAQLENNFKEVSKSIKAQKPPVEPKKPATATGKDKIEYKVKKGETLLSIAKKFKVSRDDLARWNKIDKNKTLQAGEVLVIIPR